MGETKKVRQRMWVVLDWNERRQEFAPLLETLARTRLQSMAIYTENAAGTWIVGYDYATDRKNGWVRCVAATLTLEQPKSSRS